MTRPMTPGVRHGWRVACLLYMVPDDIVHGVLALLRYWTYCYLGRGRCSTPRPTPGHILCHQSTQPLASPSTFHTHVWWGPRYGGMGVGVNVRYNFILWMIIIDPKKADRFVNWFGVGLTSCVMDGLDKLCVLDCVAGLTSTVLVR